MLYKLVCLDKEKFTSLTRNLQKKKTYGIFKREEWRHQTAYPVYHMVLKCLVYTQLTMVKLQPVRVRSGSVVSVGSWLSHCQGASDSDSVVTKK